VRFPQIGGLLQPFSIFFGAVRFVLRTLAGIVAGMALAFALVVAVELFSAIVYPIPAALEENIPEHVRRYPHWILAVVVPAWGATIAAATWVAARVGSRLAGIVVALLLAWALTFNLLMLPYTLWFKIAMFLVLPLACFAGLRYGRRGPAPATAPATISN
jgi:hypothetical protein